MKDITAIVLTKNEEQNIKSVISNIEGLTNNILIVDSGSTDKTVKIAGNLGAKVIYRAWDNDFAAQRNFALEYVKTEWVLYLDADERLNEELMKAICCAIEKNENKQYAIKRKSVAFGKKFNYGVLKPDFVPRLFKTKNVKWVNKVHERPVCNDKLEILPGYIEHYTYENWQQWLKKFDQYTTIWANNAYETGKRTTLIKGILHATFGFIQMYFLKKGFLDGVMGLVMSANHFFYTLMKYLKLIELQRKGDRI